MQVRQLLSSADFDQRCKGCRLLASVLSRMSAAAIKKDAADTLAIFECDVLNE